jgi:SAM-dependent methyltransferase
MEATAPDPWSEDLIWFARRGLELGRAHCACPGRYHWLYGTMRASGVVASLKSEEPRLASILKPLLRDGLRIMIAGSADPGLFCALGRILRSPAADITVVDRCGAPLELIREFAQARGLRCRTLNRDLLDLAGCERWDLVLSHYTLNFIVPDRRAKFFASLASVLAPGGTLVCAAMTGKAITHDDEPALAAAFVARSREAWTNMGLSSDDRATLEDILQIYAADTTAMRLIWPQADEVRACLHEAGLDILSEHTVTRDWSLFGRTETERRIDTSSIIVAVRG